MTSRHKYPLCGFRFDPALIYKLKLIALMEGTSASAISAKVLAAHVANWEAEHGELPPQKVADGAQRDEAETEE